MIQDMDKAIKEGLEQMRKEYLNEEKEPSESRLRKILRDRLHGRSLSANFE